MADSGIFDPNAAGNGVTGGSGFEVWDGTYHEDNTMAPHYGHKTTNEPQSPNMQDTTTYAIDQLPKLSNAQLRHLQEQLFTAGYISKDAVTGQFNSVTKDGYDQFLQDVASESLRHGNITPDDYMQKILKGKDPEDPNGPQGGTSTTTTVSTSQDARALALSTFQSLLGRRPSQHEMDAFYSAITAYDRAHPSVSTTTGQEADGDSSTLNSGGANDQSFAQSYVEQNYGGQMGEHSALHYFDLVNSTLTGPPAGVQHAI